MMDAEDSCSGSQPIKVKTKFLQVVESSDAKGFLEFYDQHKTKKSPFKFEQLLSSFTDDELVNSWKHVLHLVQEHAKVALKVDDSSADSADVRMSTTVIHAAAFLGNITFDHLSKVPVYMLQMILFLHDILLNFRKNQETTQDLIAKLCEKFWLKNAEGREELVANTIIYLLKFSLDVKFRKTRIKRVLLLKDCIRVVLDKEDTDKQLLQFYLNQCVTSSLYLSTKEGIKFIEFLLCLDVSSTLTYHKKIKLKFPGRSRKECLAYGTIYSNAWMHATKSDLKQLQEILEVDCIQDFMYHAVYVQRNRPKSLCPLLRKLLSVFNENKKEYKVAKMLRTLFEPILWRGLKDASGNVRANAADIFFDFFPLEDPDMDVAATELEMQRQLLLIKDLLYDECPMVRAIAAVGVCLVMAYNWDLLSTDIIKTYFKILIEDLSIDSSSADVRCAVIKGLKVLVTECESAIPHLKVLLPKFKGMFHDVSETVRVVFCQLLLAIKKVRFIKYWDIVSKDHLLARLEEDEPIIQKLLVELMYSSYLSENLSEEEWLSRCFHLIKTEPGVFKVFFNYLPEFASMQAVVKFMCAVYHILNEHFGAKKKKSQKKPLRKIDKNKENQHDIEVVASSSDSGLPDLDDPVIAARLFDTLSILWVSVQHPIEKPENKMLKKELIAKSAMCMPTLLKLFEDSKVWKQVFFLGAFIPPSFIPALSKMCFDKLQKLPENATMDDYKVLIICLHSQNKTDDMLSLIQEWIHHGLEHIAKDAPTTPKAKKLKRSPSDKTSPKPMLAVKFLELLINESACREAVLKSDHVKNLFVEELHCCKEAILGSMRTLENEDKKLFLFSSFSVIAKLVVLHEAKNAESDETLRSLVSWAANNFLSGESVGSSNSMRRSSRKSSLPVQEISDVYKELGCMICKDLFGIACDIAAAVRITEKHYGCYLEFIESALQSEYCSSYISSAAMLARRLSFYNRSIFNDVSDINFVMLRDMFDVICKSVVKENFFEEISEEEKDRLSTELKEYMLAQIEGEYTSESFTLKTVFNCLNDCLIPVIEKIDSDAEDLQLTPVASMFLSLISGEELLGLLIKGISSWIKDKEIKYLVAASWILIKTIQNNKNAIKKQGKDIRQVVLDFQNIFKDFKLEASPPEEISLINWYTSQIEATLSLLRPKNK